MEAAYDLGATRGQVIRTIVIPLLRPALFSTGLLILLFHLMILFFHFSVQVVSAQTLPIYIFA